MPGIHFGGGELYGNAWTSAPKPSTAACRVETILACSGVGVLVPVLMADVPLRDFFGKGESSSILVNLLFKSSTTLVRNGTGEQRIMPERVDAAPFRTSS